MVEVWPPRNVPSRRGIWYFCEFGSSAPFNCNPHKNFQEYLIRAKMQLRCHQPCCHTFETDVTNLLSRMSLAQHTRTILIVTSSIPEIICKNSTISTFHYPMYRMYLSYTSSTCREEDSPHESHHLIKNQPRQGIRTCACARFQ